MKKKVIAAGHICLDITPVFPADGGDGTGKYLQPGKLYIMGKADVHTGGSVANTGLGLKALGADVKLMGKIGDDPFGDMVRRILRDQGAEEGLIEVPGETTSYSVVLAPPGRDRCFLHCLGANATFSSEDIPDEALQDAALFHFGYPTLMPRFYADDGKELVRLFQRVKREGLATSLDLTQVDPKSEAGRVDWRRILESVLPYVDFFVPSFDELCGMLSREHYEALEARAGENNVTDILSLHADAEPLAEECLALGAASVLIKCGAAGLFFRSGDDMERTGPRLGLNASRFRGISLFQPSYRIGTVLSGTGAGDTAIAAFLCSLLEGFGPKEALEHAAAAGALCCTAYDAVSAIPPLEALRAKIDAGWETNKPPIT